MMLSRSFKDLKIVFALIASLFVCQILCAQYGNEQIIYADSVFPIESIKKSFLNTEVDGEGYLDILYSKRLNEETSHLRSYNQTSPNSFENSAIIQTIDSEISDNKLFHADMNGNLRNDIVFNYSSNSVGVLVNEGSGVYASEPLVSEITIVENVRYFRINDIGDMDDDGDHDLLITVYVDKDYYPMEDSSLLLIGKNDGTGLINTFIRLEDEHTAAYHKVFSADLDGDEDNDVITVGFRFAPDFAIGMVWYYDPFMRWYENVGEGLFSEAINVNLPQRNDRPAVFLDLNVADLENDGDMDVFGSFAVRESCEDPLHNFNCEFYYIYGVYSFNESLNNLEQKSEFNSWPHDFTIESNNDYYSDAFVPFLDDVNQDGNIDVLTASSSRGKLLWKLGDGNGFFEDEIIISNLEGHHRPILKSADMNDDGDLDIFSLTDADSLNVLSYFEDQSNADIDEDEDGHLVGIDCDDNNNQIGDTLPDLAYTEDISICELDDIAFETSNAINNATYNWSGPNGYNSTEIEPVISNVSLTDAGAYSVFASLNHCITDTVSIIVDVKELPDVQIIEFEDSLIADGNDLVSFQWFLNDQIIVGAIDQYFLASESGYYQVEVENEEMCSAISDSVFVNVVGLSLNDISSFLVFPNPVKRNTAITIKSPEALSYPIVVDVNDHSGRLVEQYTLNNSEGELKTTAWSCGLYFVTIRTKLHSVSQKILILE